LLKKRRRIRQKQRKTDRTPLRRRINLTAQTYDTEEVCLLICFHLYIFIAPICIFTCYRYSIIYIGSCLFTQTPRALTPKRGKHQKQTQGEKRQTSKHRETGNYRVQRRCKKSAIYGCASRFIYVTLDPSCKRAS